MSKKFVPRQLTVKYLHQPRAYSCYVQVPFINIAGIWLAKAGFNIGDKVAVEVSDKKLVIKRLTAAELQRMQK